MQTLLSEGEAQPEAMQSEQCCRQGHQQWTPSLPIPHITSHTHHLHTHHKGYHPSFVLSTHIH